MPVKYPLITSLLELLKFQFWIVIHFGTRITLKRKFLFDNWQPLSASEEKASAYLFNRGSQPKSLFDE
jgi:hypothetical protein